MKFIEIQPNEESVNVDYIHYFHAHGSGTRIYCDDGVIFETEISYSVFKDLVELANKQLIRKVEQLARYQSIPTP